MVLVLVLGVAVLSYPRSYPTGVGDGKLTEDDYNAMKAILDGFTPEGVFVNPNKYVISTDGVDTYAHTAFQLIYGGPDDEGGIDGGDPESVIEQTLSEGGCSALTKGTYEIDSSIILTKDVYAKLYGEPGAIIKATANINMFDITDNNSDFYVDFEGVTFDHNSVANRGIIVFYSTNSYLHGRITNCRFINLKTSTIGNQVQFDGGVVSGCFIERDSYDSQDAFAYDGKNAIFSHNYFHNGYLGTGTADNIVVNGNVFHNDAWATGDFRVGMILQPQTNEVKNVAVTGNVFENSVLWMDVVAGATAGIKNVAITGNAFYVGRLLLVDNEDNGWLNHITITGNTFKDSGKDCITSENCGDMIIDSNSFENSNMDNDAGELFAPIQLKGLDGTCQIYGNSFVRTAGLANDTPYAIRLRDGGVGAVIIKNNHFGNIRVSPIQVSNPPTTYIIKENYGYATENRDTSTGTGAQQTIAHGLAGTPDYVWFSNIDDGANPYQSAAADATNIYVTAVNAKDYAWEAEYVP